MRKLFGIFIVTLLIITAIPTLGKMDNKISYHTIYYEKEKSINSLPSEWDWRDVDGIDWTTPVKNLLGNPFCQVFSYLSALEACIQIMDGDPWGCDLSEAHLICYCGGPDSMIHPVFFVSDVISKGVVDEECFPFSSNIDCDDICDDWEERTTKILGTRKMGGTSEEDRNKIKKFLIKYGPLQATMDQYQDFQTYNGGIYEHQSGNFLSTHGVAIIGYNDNPGYWIGKDQKGTDWGEDGWFRIKYGECKIENSLYYIQLRENPTPEKPNIPTGSSSGKPGEEYTYTTSSSDIESDELYYKWDWGDGNVSDWFGPYDSGVNSEASYIWANEGEYNISVKAKDDFFGESEWSDPLEISMPKTKSITGFNPLIFRLIQRFQIFDFIFW